MPNILIVSEREPIRCQMREIIERELKQVVIGVAADAEQALHLLSSHPWKLAIIDLALPQQSWVPLLTHLKHQTPPMPALMIGVKTLDDDVPYAWTLGAKGFLLDDFTPEEFVAAFFSVLHGGTYTNARIMAALNSQLF
ncbi:MAG: response regulator transcription factor [Acidobacteria bacterium]|nr:response regulator transcription factor [Acidobacteriota bacterium]